MSEQYVDQEPAPAPHVEPRRRLTFRKVVASALMLTIVGGITYKSYDTVRDMATSDDTPAWMFPPADLPPGINVGAGPTMVCAEDTDDCSRDTALAFTGGYAFKEAKADDVKRFMHQ